MSRSQSSGEGDAGRTRGQSCCDGVARPRRRCSRQRLGAFDSAVGPGAGWGDGFIANRRQQALRYLPGQFAFAFRGVLSLWTTGELPDEALVMRARDGRDLVVRPYRTAAIPGTQLPFGLPTYRCCNDATPIHYLSMPGRRFRATIYPLALPPRFHSQFPLPDFRQQKAR